MHEIDPHQSDGAYNIKHEIDNACANGMHELVHLLQTSRKAGSRAQGCELHYDTRTGCKIGECSKESVQHTES